MVVALAVGVTVIGLLLPPVIAALVAILLTGKITAATADRALARKLHFRIDRALVVTEAGEQRDWRYLASADLEQIERRLADLGDETVTLDHDAAQSLWHAAQLIAVFARMRDSANEAEGTLGRGDALSEERRLRELRAVVEGRDGAIDTLRCVYVELLEAQKRLRRIGRWLRVIGAPAPLPLSAAYDAARRYAETVLGDTQPYAELSTEELERLRLHGMVIWPPTSGNAEIDAKVPRRNLGTGDLN